MEGSEHQYRLTSGPTVEELRRIMVNPSNARELLAQEIRVLRRIKVPNRVLEKIIRMKKRDYPLYYGEPAKALNRPPNL